MSVNGILYWGRTTDKFLDFGFFGSGKDVRFGIFPHGIWGLGGFAIDRRVPWNSKRRILSPNPAICVFISDDVHDINVFAIVFALLTLSLRGLMTTCDCPRSA